MGKLHAFFEELSEFLKGDSDEAAWRAMLGIAAALAEVGGDAIGVDGAEWTGACACAGVRGPDALFERVLERLVALSIAERGEEGRWRFVSVEEVRALADISTDEKRWGRYHGACARVLSKLYDEAARDAQGAIVAA